MSGIIGKKLGMTSIFNPAGNNVICTVIETGVNVVTQVKTVESDGYNAVQVGLGERKVKRTSKALQGHFKAANTEPKRKVKEFRNYSVDAKLGGEVTASDFFAEGELIDVVGISKGKGFQGVVRRHGFSGVGMRTHGQHNRGRAPGSIGASSYPSRVFKGMRMAGRMGGDRVKVKNLQVVRIMEEQGLILIKGAVPGPKNGYVELHKRKTA